MATESDTDVTKQKGSRGLIKRASHGQGTFAPVTKKVEDRDKLLDKLRTEQTGPRSREPIKDPPSKEEAAQPAGQSKGEKPSTAGTSTVRRRKTVRRPRTDGRHKKRAVVYHEEEKYPGWGYSDSHGHYHGRRGSSGSADDYVRGSTSDEYKRRMHETQEKMREERKTEAEDIGYFYKIVAAVLALIIILLSTVIFFIASRETLFNEYDLTYTMNLETMRYELGILTENIDCSIHMKRRLMQEDSPTDVIRQGLMCLYALAPHTVHEFSSVQMVFFHRLSIALFAEYLELHDMTKPCDANQVKPFCKLYDIPYVLNAVAYLNGTLRDSELSNAFREGHALNTTYNEALWSRSYWKGLTLNKDEVTVKPRQFRVPPLLVNLSRRTPNIEHRMKQWKARFPKIEIKALSTSDVIKITPAEAKDAARIFASSTVEPRNVQDKMLMFPLTLDEVTRRGLSIIFPQTSTSRSLSFLSAFIIKVVYDAFKKAQPTHAAISLQLMSVQAQMIAMQFIKGTREWTGNPKDESIMNKMPQAVDLIIKQSLDQSPLNVFRNNSDRVSSVLLWSENKERKVLSTFEFGLPQLFDPNDSHGKRLKYAPFVHINGEKSVEYSSAAGVILVETFKVHVKPVMAAVASGTERTVEGVANAILRVLLLKNATGDAVTPERAYLDPVNGMVTCDKHTDAQFTEHFGVGCHRSNWREPDRSVMIGEKHLMKGAMTFAMTQSLGEYNYAVGY